MCPTEKVIEKFSMGSSPQVVHTEVFTGDSFKAPMSPNGSSRMKRHSRVDTSQSEMTPACVAAATRILFDPSSSTLHTCALATGSEGLPAAMEHSPLNTGFGPFTSHSSNTPSSKENPISRRPSAWMGRSMDLITEAAREGRMYRGLVKDSMSHSTT